MRSGCARRCAAATFAFRSAPHIHGTWVRLPSGARYLYKAFIRPAYRGRGIAPELYVRASQMCPRRGTRLGVLTVDVDNTRGLRTARRSGWNPVGSAGFWQLARWVLPFRSAGARRYGFGFYWLGVRGGGRMEAGAAGAPGTAGSG